MKSLRQVIATRITRSKRNVFLTCDFADLSDGSQVIRALRSLIADLVLVRLGKGVYAKVRESSISGRVVLANPGGFQVVAQEALTRLGVEWEPTGAQLAFAAGTSTPERVNPFETVI